MRRKKPQRIYSDIKPWIQKAIAREARRPPDPLWENGPTEQGALDQREQLIRLLQKHRNANPAYGKLSERLDNCYPNSRCLSGACPECLRLLQRWLVRRLGIFIRKNFNEGDGELVMITIVPPASIVPVGTLPSWSMKNHQRRFKYVFESIGLHWAVGGLDFSLNERDGQFPPHWRPHYQLVTTIDDISTSKLNKLFTSTKTVPRPIKIESFDCTPYGLSYLLKTAFYRRIGYDEIKVRNGKQRRCRNTRTDKLQAAERLELAVQLNDAGLASRLFFGGVKPFAKSIGVKLVKWPSAHRIKLSI
jgi:hypothetical protein